MVLIQKDRFMEVEKILEYFIGRIKEYKKIGVAAMFTSDICVFRDESLGTILTNTKPLD